jgi:hypothetical protein
MRLSAKQNSRQLSIKLFVFRFSPRPMPSVASAGEENTDSMGILERAAVQGACSGGFSTRWHALLPDAHAVGASFPSKKYLDLTSISSNMQFLTALHHSPGKDLSSDGCRPGNN